MPVLPLLLACAPGAPDAFLAYVRGDDGYVVEPRALPALEDAGTMTGTLGSVRHGGRVVGNGAGEQYSGGRGLTVRYVVQDGVAVPLDQDGLLLYSFYGHLADATDTLEAGGLDLDAIFPVDIAWNPAVSPLLELAPADNAAYAIGANVFLLLPDGDNREVPLLANAGVVTHELGHAVLHLLMTGDPSSDPLVADTSTAAGMWQSALHEGFADSLAALTLDDPRFLDVSLDMPARYADTDAVLTAALLPDPAAVADSLLPIYDPYPLGTVFASLMWDIRVATDDAPATLELLFRGVEHWAPSGPDDLDGAVFLGALVAAAEPGTQRDVVCAAVELRIDGLLAVAGCP
ncbi:MAG: hypothetical protein Q8P41_00610 [Pseudomonadota bacterium]|nr:hypothetical protein [Pseudomonadota bacterium]